MYLITKKENLSKTCVLMNVYAPLVARKAQAGQFVILRADNEGERIPFTISDSDAKTGEISIVFQAEGSSTKKLAPMKKGDYLEDFVGPLGMPAELSGGWKKVLVIAGGTGVANAYPITKKLFENGCDVHAILGFKTADRVMLEEYYKKITSVMHVVTRDGSHAEKGRVTDVLDNLLEKETYDRIFAIGPLTMMRDVCEKTRACNIPTTVGMSTIMLDGTGICGGCRLTVNGQTKFACIDGPDFDGFAVDFDEAINRSTAYDNHERCSDCNLVRKQK